MSNAMIGMLLKGLGIEINPEELIGKIDEMAKFVSDMHASQARCEALLLEIKADLNTKYGANR